MSVSIEVPLYMTITTIVVITTMMAVTMIKNKIYNDKNNDDSDNDANTTLPMTTMATTTATPMTIPMRTTAGYVYDCCRVSCSAYYYFICVRYSSISVFTKITIANYSAKLIAELFCPELMQNQTSGNKIKPDNHQYNQANAKTHHKLAIWLALCQRIFYKSKHLHPIARLRE